jgi:tetratricopeptide (TPR) repeat protein
MEEASPCYDPCREKTAVSFLRRMFSPSYRRAVSAEAGGNYLLAARAFALCGLPEKVAEMHLLEAERSTSAAERLDELRAAVHFAREDTETGRRLLLRISRSYLNLCKKGVVTQHDRALCREAARLALRGGDPLLAAQAYELLGDETQAAEAWKEAGEVERMEAVLGREERRQKEQRDQADRFEDYRMNLRLGRRDEALAALSECLVPSPQRDERERLFADLDRRLLRGGKVVLRHGDREGVAQVTIYVGTFPLLIGRGAECQLVLRDAGISRVHASIQAAAGAGPFAVRDLGSRNGTTLNGLPIAGELALRDQGDLGIGEGCTLRFQVEGERLSLAVTRGMDSGLRLVASPGPLLLDQRGSEISFPEGRPRLSCREGETMVLNGQRVGPMVQLITGDVVETAGAHYEVLG